MMSKGTGRRLRFVSFFVEIRPYKLCESKIMEVVMIQISCQDIKKYYGSQLVLDGVCIEVKDGERIALVGKNGCGKTTLLKILVGVETYESGQVAIRKGATVGYLEQIPTNTKDKTVRTILNMAFEEQMLLKEQMDDLERKMACSEGEELEKILNRYGTLTEQYECLGGYEINERLAKITSGLKFSDLFLSQYFEDLSGGEKTVVMLAKVLLQEPDILVLDEPTNHLDMGMLDWLEEYLKTYKGCILIVSHDRYFLDLVATKVVDLEEYRLTTFVGNYSNYVLEKAKRREEQLEAYKEQQKKIKAMEKSIRDMRTWAAAANNEKMFRRAENMRKRLERMDKIERPKSELNQLQLSFEANDRSGKDVLVLDEVGKSFGEKTLFQAISMEVYFREHIALIGKNGCGKSTLLRMILGEEAVEEGVIQLGSSLKIGYLPQVVSFKEEELTVLETFREPLVLSEGKGRALLARYFFYGDMVYKKVKNLSGGEKSRLKLAMLMQQEINFLILDEPTNHLDIASRESLEEALLMFEGTILFVSHDRYFINRIATRICELEVEQIKDYFGDYEYYKEKKVALLQEIDRTRTEQIANRQTESQSKQGVKSIEKKKSKAQNNQNPQNTYLQKQLEAQIESLEEALKMIQEEMITRSIDYVKLMELKTKEEEINHQLEALLERYLFF